MKKLRLNLIKLNIMKTELFVPRHPFASENLNEKGHIYMPGSLLTAGACLASAGAEIGQITDTNFPVEEYPEKPDLIGISVTGAPMIPSILTALSNLRLRYGDNVTVVLGGRVIEGLASSEFKRFFGQDDVQLIQARSLSEVANRLNLPNVPSPDHSVSLIELYRSMIDERLLEYLKRESALYLSNNCRYKCRFCAAQTGQKEQFRNMDSLQSDLQYLCKKAIEFGLDSLSFYLTSLDLFQSPKSLKRFVEMMEEIMQEFPEIEINLRGLSNVATFLKVSEDEPELISRLKAVGLNTLGFGVDASTDEVRTKLKKRHVKSLEQCEVVVRLAHSFGISPQLLTIVGHPSVDTQESMKRMYEFLCHMRLIYAEEQLQIRLHIASIVPGSKIWSENGPQVQKIKDALSEDPELWKSLDFLAEPNRLKQGGLETTLKSFYWMMRIVQLDSRIQPLSGKHRSLNRVPIIGERLSNAWLSLNEGKFDI